MQWALERVLSGGGREIVSATSSERPKRRSRGRMRTGVSWRLKVAERGAQAADGCVDAASKQND
jgi:hypothetical protein